MMDRLLHRLRDEAGTTLLEVLAAAVILVVIAGSVTALMNGAQRESGQSRMIAIAGDLAQSELEMLRAKRFSDLVAIGTSAPAVEKTAGGLTFNVQKSAQWASQGASGPTDCGSTANAPEALRVSVAVTWESMSRKPVRLDTLVAAPTSEETNGVFVVQINDRNGEGVAGVNVTLSGPETATQTTDDSGCLRFPDLTQGDYTLTVTKSEYVDRTSAPVVTKTVSVNGGETGSTSVDYDWGGGINVRFVRGNSTNTPVAVPAAIFSFDQTTVDGVLDASKSIATQPKRLWPATAQYEVHADTCSTATPAGGFAVQPGVLNPGRQDIKIPMIRVRATNIPAEIAPLLQARIRTECGTTLADVSGSPSSGGWLSNPIPVPPGKIQSACVWGSVPGYGSGYIQRLNPGTVGTTAADYAGTKELSAGDAGTAKFASPVCP